MKRIVLFLVTAVLALTPLSTSASPLDQRVTDQIQCTYGYPHYNHHGVVQDGLASGEVLVSVWSSDGGHVSKAMNLGHYPTTVKWDPYPTLIHGWTITAVIKVRKNATPWSDAEYVTAGCTSDNG